MKKIIALFLSVMMIVALCGCDTIDKLKEVAPPALPEVEETPEPETTEIEAEASLEIAVENLNNYITVNTTKTTKLFYDPQNEKTLILTFAYDAPKVYIDGRTDASSAINEYLGMLDETYYTGNDYGAGTSYGVNLLYELAIDNYTYLYNNHIRDGKYDLASSREASVARADSEVFSIVFNDYVYISASEESHAYKAYNFSTDDGALLTLENISDDYSAFAAFAADYMAKLADTADYKNVLSKANIKNYINVVAPLVREGSWFFGNEGIEFFTEMDELCEGSGIVRFIIPYGELADKINTKFIPAQRQGEGKADIILQSNYADGTIEIIDLVNVDTAAEGLVLCADGTIYDVAISSVAYDNITDSFMTTAEHWFCSYMQDNAVQISVVIPDGMPTLMISYRTASGELIQKLVTESGEDGSIILMNTDITAVG